MSQLSALPSLKETNNMTYKGYIINLTILKMGSICIPRFHESPQVFSAQLFGKALHDDDPIESPEAGSFKGQKKNLV